MLRGYIGGSAMCDGKVAWHTIVTLFDKKKVLLEREGPMDKKEKERLRNVFEHPNFSESEKDEATERHDRLQHVLTAAVAEDQRRPAGKAVPPKRNASSVPEGGIAKKFKTEKTQDNDFNDRR